MDQGESVVVSGSAYTPPIRFYRVYLKDMNFSRAHSIVLRHTGYEDVSIRGIVIESNHDLIPVGTEIVIPLTSVFFYEEWEKAP